MSKAAKYFLLIRKFGLRGNHEKKLLFSKQKVSEEKFDYFLLILKNEHDNGRDT